MRNKEVIFEEDGKDKGSAHLDAESVFFIPEGVPRYVERVKKRLEKKQ